MSVVLLYRLYIYIHTHMHTLFIYGASQAAQTVKNLPAVGETQVQSLGQEDPLEKGKAVNRWMDK